MNRRRFLKNSFLASSALAFAAPHLSLKAEQTSAPDKFILSAPLTHSDWMLKPGIAWGAEGVHHMLDQCKEAGWSKIYWRATDGGRSLYHSKLMRPMGKWDDDSFWSPQTDADKALFRRFMNMNEDQRKAMLANFDRLDYATFDHLAEAVRYGHKIGLEIHAWVTVNEDDHGWGLQSEFSRKHPEFRWRGRNGKVYHSQLSFAFPEVKKYKLAIIRELLGNYDLDGFFLDWIRTGDVRDNPQTDGKGIADYGYEKPLVEKFKKKFGDDPDKIANDDPRWIQFRAEPQTEFMRAARKLIHSSKRKLPISVMVGHPWHYRGEQNKIDGNLRGLLLDVNCWAKEGLFDSVVAAGYYRDGGNAEMVFKALQKETENKSDVWLFGWVPGNIPAFEKDAVLAKSVGAKEILFWEADYIEGASAELKAAMTHVARFTSGTRK